MTPSGRHLFARAPFFCGQWAEDERKSKLKDSCVHKNLISFPRAMEFYLTHRLAQRRPQLLRATHEQSTEAYPAEAAKHFGRSRNTLHSQKAPAISLQKGLRENGQLIPWNVTVICEMCKLLIMLENIYVKGVLENHLVEQLFLPCLMIEYHQSFAKDQIRLHLFGDRSFLASSLALRFMREGGIGKEDIFVTAPENSRVSQKFMFQRRMQKANLESGNTVGNIGLLPFLIRTSGRGPCCQAAQLLDGRTFGHIPVGTQEWRWHIAPQVLSSPSRRTCSGHCFWNGCHCHCR